MNFRTWLAGRPELSAATIKHYYGAIFGSRLNELAVEELGCKNIYDYSSAEEFLPVLDKILKSEEFIEFNARGHRMYKSALRAYQAFLQEESNETTELEEDLQNLDRLPIPNDTERRELHLARIGQGIYRQRLLKFWHEKCAVTGFSNPDMLLASHIKPWRLSDNCERLDPCNGLLLSPALDRAFDRGFIT
ncbi:MAG: HNH endonuclease, partial [Mesosutterella sp.]|nr:HNH endonuclease [Mesosutterella sp.]